MLPSEEGNVGKCHSSTKGPDLDKELDDSDGLMKGFNKINKHCTFIIILLSRKIAITSFPHNKNYQ